MALILELVDPRGTRTWHRLDALPLTLGRALANDVILDDPYVDARHARIAMDAAGALRVEDQGSTNGLRLGATRVDGHLVAQPGTELRIGRTTLRFHDADEAVPPALVDDAMVPAAAVATPLDAPMAPPEARPAAAGRTGRVRDWLATTPGRLVAIVAATALFALYSWLQSTERASASGVFTAALGFVLMAALWAGLWSVASRIIVHRFEFVGHLTVIVLAVIAVMTFGVVDQWLAFVFPDSPALPVLSTVLALALLAVVVAAHLSLATTMPRQRRWRVGVVISAVVAAVMGLGALADDDDAFTDVPEFAGVVKPMPAGWVPTKSVDDFAGVMKELKEDVDEMATKSRDAGDAGDTTDGAAPAGTPEPRPAAGVADSTAAAGAR